MIQSTRKQALISNLKSRKLHIAVAFLIFAVVGGIIYSNTLNAPFLYDDHQSITGCSFIRIKHLNKENIDKFLHGLAPSIFNRPFSSVTFAFNYYFGQYNVFGYHLFNIAIHLINGFLLFLFLQSTLQIHNKRSQYRWSIISPDQIAFFSALLWLVHPLHTQSVTYIVQRMNSMAAMFFLVSMLCYMNGRLRQQEGLCKMKLPASRKRTGLWLTGCIIAGIFAFLSKQNAAVLPFFIILYEWFFFQDLSFRWFLQKALPGLLIVLLFTFFTVTFLGIHPLDKMMSLFPPMGFTLSQRLLSEFRVVVYYLSLLVYPAPNRLNLDYFYPLSFNLITPPTTVIALFSVVGLFTLSGLTIKKDRLIAFSIFWYFGNLLIESSVIALDLIYEHRTYLPSMFICFLFVSLFLRYSKHLWVVVSIACGVFLLFSTWTVQRNTIWSDELTFWQDCSYKAPTNARPYLNIGHALNKIGRVNEALNYYLLSLKLKPDYDIAHYDLGVLLNKLGRTQEAIEHYVMALKINPELENAHNNLGEALIRSGSHQEGIDHYLKALQINPNYAVAHVNLGIALNQLGNTEEAIEHYYMALKINPELEIAHKYLGDCLIRTGNPKEAIDHYLRALQINPKNKMTHNNLGNALISLEKTEEAIHHYLKALQINPNFERAHNNLGNTLVKLGRTDEAITHYFQSLTINPDNPLIHYNLAVALYREGNINEAIQHLQTTVKLSPDNTQAEFFLERLLNFQKNK